MDSLIFGGRYCVMLLGLRVIVIMVLGGDLCIRWVCSDIVLIVVCRLNMLVRVVVMYLLVLYLMYVLVCMLKVLINFVSVYFIVNNVGCEWLMCLRFVVVLLNILVCKLMFVLLWNLVV